MELSIEVQTEWALAVCAKILYLRAMPDRKRTGLDWEDVKVFLAFAREGGLSPAARALGVNHATIARRIASLQNSLGGVSLAERTADGYVLTPAGQAVLAEAGDMERSAHALGRAAEIGDSIAGQVCVSTTASFAEHVLADSMARLAERHAALELELVGEDRNVRLARGEADIAIRFGKPQSDDALIREVGPAAYHLYGAPDYLAQTAPADRRLIGFSRAVEEMAPAAARLTELAAGRDFLLRCGGVSTQAKAARSAGVALLPAYLGDRTAGLVRVDAQARAAWSHSLWLIVRSDVRRVARVRHVADFLRDEILGKASLLQGAAGAA